jgi:hypothetical protein
MSTRKKPKKFAGPLAEPIAVKGYRPTLVGLTATEAAKKAAGEWVRAMKLSLAKLEYLFEHFAIAKTGDESRDYQELSLRLAQEFVPGFQFVDAGRARRGRPTRDPLDLIRLLTDVES